MKTLITGGSGKLGREMIKMFPESLHPSHVEFDVTNRTAVFDFMENEKPEAVIHCAALTGIRECEKDQKTAWKINVLGTDNIVKALERYQKDCYFIYISTACVFHGDVGN